MVAHKEHVYDSHLYVAGGREARPRGRRRFPHPAVSREEEETTSMTSSFAAVGGFTPGATMARPALSLDAPGATAAVHV